VLEHSCCAGKQYLGRELFTDVHVDLISQAACCKGGMQDRIRTTVLIAFWLCVIPSRIAMALTPPVFESAGLGGIERDRTLQHAACVSVAQYAALGYVLVSSVPERTYEAPDAGDVHVWLLMMQFTSGYTSKQRRHCAEGLVFPARIRHPARLA
jgi:hypothetical protein